MTQQTSSQKNFGRKLLLRSTFVIAIVVALFLILLPIGTKYYLKQWLLDNGADQATIDSVGINILTGKFKLAGVDVRKEGQTLFSDSDIEVDLGLMALFDREILLQEAVLDTVTIDIEQYDNGNVRIGSYTIQADPEPVAQTETEDEQPWIFRTQQLSLSNVTIHYKQPDIDLKLLVEKGNAKRFATDPHSTGGTVFLQGTLNNAPLEIDLSMLRIIPDIEVKGTVAITDFKLDALEKITRESLQQLAGLFSGQGKIDLAISKVNAIKAAYKGKLSISEYTVDQDAYTTGGKQVQWEGDVSYASAEQKIDLEGILNGQELHGTLTEPSYQASLARVDIEPKLSIILGEATEITAEGNLQTENFALGEPEKEKPLLALNTLNVSNINWSDTGGLLVDKMEVDSITANIVQEKSTDQETPDDQEPEEKREPKEDPAPEKTGTPPIRINDIAFKGDNRLTIIDRTLSSPFRSTLVVTSLLASNIDTSKPDEAFTYSLEGSFDEIAPLKINGSAHLFGDALIVDQETQLRNYSLPRISPYVVDTIGTAFEAGQMDLTSTFTIKADTIDSTNNVVLKNIEIRTVNDELHKEFSNLLPVPLDFALSLLKDGKGDIDLDVPVSGQFSDLNVGIADVLTTAFSKAIVTGVTPYMAYMFLGPTSGTLAYLGVKATRKLLNAGFPVLEYETGTSALSEESKETLTRIGKKIEKEKEDSFTVCARLPVWELAGDMEKTTENQHTTMNDENQTKQLFEVGQKRTRDVHAFLLENFDIDKERLLMCDPGLKLDKDSVGTVEILK